MEWHQDSDLQNTELAGVGELKELDLEGQLQKLEMGKVAPWQLKDQSQPIGTQSRVFFELNI